MSTFQDEQNMPNQPVQNFNDVQDPQMIPAPGTPAEPSQKKKSIAVPIIIAAAAVVIIAAAVFVAFNVMRFKSPNVNVNDVTIGEWTVDGNDYKAEITSSTKKSFIAVATLRSKSGTSSSSQYIYMKDGIGTIETSDSFLELIGADKDGYTVDSYYPCVEMSQKLDFSKIDIEVSDRYDDSSSNKTFLFCNIKFNTRQKLNGMIFFKVKNNETGEESSLLWTPVIDGKAWYENGNGEFGKNYKKVGLWAYLNNPQPYQTISYMGNADNAISLKEAYFVPMTPLSESSVTMQEPEYSMDNKVLCYTGVDISVRVDGSPSGELLFTWEQTDGGLAQLRNITHMYDSTLNSGSASISIKQWYYQDEMSGSDFTDPTYSCVCKGYIQPKGVGQ